jgi:hypothetical protein
MSQAMRASMPITKEGYLVKQGGLIRNWKKVHQTRADDQIFRGDVCTALTVLSSSVLARLHGLSGGSC